jgi:putative chitobiose transport system permease protein
MTAIREAQKEAQKTVEVATPRERRRRPRSSSSIILTALAVVIAMVFILPVLWIFIDSFRPNLDIFSSLSPLSWRVIIPSQLTFENYIGIFVNNGFGLALWNSFVVCIASVAVGLLVSVTAAYALSVFEFPGRNLIFAIVVVSFMIPFEAVAIPLSQLFTNWGLDNTLFGLILPGIGNGLAIFNLRQYFRGIPVSYREAAMLDGASEPRILFGLYLRMSGPALTNSALLIFLGQWASYLWPLLIVTNSNLQLAPVALATTFGQHTSSYGENFAGTIMLALVPAVTLFILQRFFGRLSLGSGEK